MGPLDERIGRQQGDGPLAEPDGGRIVAERKRDRRRRARAAGQPSVELALGERGDRRAAGPARHLYGTNSLPRSSRPMMIRMMLRPPSAPTRYDITPRRPSSSPTSFV